MRDCRTSMARRAGCTMALAAALAVSSLAAGRSGAVTIAETGSTLIYPMFKAWVAAYAKIDPDVNLTISATDSGAGIAQAIAKQVQIGVSDAYMSDNQAMANPHILNIPLAIAAQTVEANLPELRGTPLKLSGPVLVAIYSGKVREWDAEPIASLNRGVHLPHHAIVPVRRADSSGDTFVFTQFLTFSTPAWENRIGYGTTVSRPSTSGVLTASGNQEMVQVIARTQYAIGYVGASFGADADKAGLITAMLENQDGKFLLPTSATIAAAAAPLTPPTPPTSGLRSCSLQGRTRTPSSTTNMPSFRIGSRTPRLRRPSAISSSGVSHLRAAAPRASSILYISSPYRHRSARAVKYRSPKSSRWRSPLR
jgi:phosphate transport system substrate-binding protein